MMFKNFVRSDKLEKAKEVNCSEIVNASVPIGYRDFLISELNQDFVIVSRWSKIGHQFNLGQWVKDTDWQIALLSGKKIQTLWHIRNIYYFCKNFLLITVIVPLLILQGKVQDISTKQHPQHKKSWLIGYSVSGSNRRTVTLKNDGPSNHSFSIIFLASGYLAPSVFRIFSFSDYFASLRFLLKAVLRINMVKINELSYFFKEILDSHCFLHSMISFSASRNKVKKISVVSEGFPRERCLYASKNIFVERVNVSPTINLRRPNTLFWSGKRYLSEKYKIEGKKQFLEKLPIYKKRILDLEGLVEELKAFNSRVVIVTGFSLRSSEKMKSFYSIIKNRLSSDIEVVLREHPRRVSGDQMDPKQSDIVLACITTQYAINRYLKYDSTPNFHIVTDKDFVWDPSPYLNIPLVVEQSLCM